VSEHNRRDFLKMSGLAASALAATGTLKGSPAIGANSAERTNASGAATSSGNAKSISVWVTDDNHQLAQTSPIEWQPVAGAAAENAIVLDPKKKFQEILGFGAAFTDAACFTFNRLDPAARGELFRQLFHPSEMDLSVCRTCIGASDYSTKVYSFDEGDPDPELRRFSIDHDREYILPMLREARQANPDLFLFSSPWSPPGWMKSNNSMLGGNMQRRSFAPYANYFLKFLQAYEAEHVAIDAVTVQNEVDTDQDGRMPACTWPEEYEADFVGQQLGPVFAKNGVKTKIWIIDHNYNLWGRAIAELETPGVAQFTSAIAWHGYAGKVEWIDRVHDAFPNVEMYWTEGGPAYTDLNYAKDWAKWSAMYSQILRHWCRSITAWNFALDETGHPNIGPFYCGGLVTIDSKTKAISYSGQYHAFAHYSRFIRRGALRFDSRNQTADVSHVAFENPDARRVLVLTNAGEAKQCQIRLGDAQASLSLSGNSVVTVVW
jgi:glucosylceramidase